ncbi:hypothetical protein [Seonamhaeicola marinus]|uniref:TonB C-terminal domain-containing protein n=1 Tax=Seonamhaeicola marinus TaxID=1912246 RepID=A0A5D0HNC2_9FLAO|nr:hypothetical protein [Seonamhaeicola marinus]TYA71557.1 hypothetical protein FUA24_18440 [Seonamhaeicola marinus]
MRHFLLLVSFSILSNFVAAQKDSIIKYYDINNKIINDNELVKNEARKIEILTKEDDSLWMVRIYRRNGKLIRYGHFKSKNKKVPVGEFISYNRKDSISGILYYNSKGLKHGKTKTWFSNRNRKSEGIYLENKKEGVWKHYHYDGSVAVKSVFKNDSLLMRTFYNEEGDIINYRGTDKFFKPKFKGGKNKFNRIVGKVLDKIDYNLDGTVHVNFTVDISGNIINVEVENKELPSSVINNLTAHFEGIKGWQPALHLNRKLPYDFSIPLKFRSLK